MKKLTVLTCVGVLMSISFHGLISNRVLASDTTTSSTTTVEASYVYYAPKPTGKWKLRKTIYTKVGLTTVINAVAYAIGTYITIYSKVKAYQFTSALATYFFNNTFKLKAKYVVSKVYTRSNAYVIQVKTVVASYKDAKHHQKLVTSCHNDFGLFILLDNSSLLAVSRGNGYASDFYFTHSLILHPHLVRRHLWWLATRPLQTW